MPRWPSPESQVTNPPSTIVNGYVPTWSSTLRRWIPAAPQGGTGGGSGNIDGGQPDSEYGGTEPVDGGTI